MPDGAMWSGAVAVTVDEATTMIPSHEAMVIHLAARSLTRRLLIRPEAAAC